MKRRALFMSVCLFMCCNNTDKPHVSEKIVSEQLMLSMLSEIASTTQVIPPPILPASSEADTLDDGIISYEDSGYDDYDDYIDALQGTAILRDTLIPITKNFAILYTEYNEKLDLWYKLHIVNLNKKDTMRVLSTDDDYDYGSELGVHEVSPNLRYVIVDIIWKGFVSAGIDGPKPFLHEVYSCRIVDIEKAEIIWSIVDKFICEWEALPDLESINKEH